MGCERGLRFASPADTKYSAKCELFNNSRSMLEIKVSSHQNSARGSLILNLNCRSFRSTKERRCFGIRYYLRFKLFRTFESFCFDTNKQFEYLVGFKNGSFFLITGVVSNFPVCFREQSVEVLLLYANIYFILFIRNKQCMLFELYSTYSVLEIFTQIGTNNNDMSP